MDQEVVMQVEVSKTDEYYQIKIPIKERYTNQYIRRFMDYLKIKKNAEKSTATDEDIRRLPKIIYKQILHNHPHDSIVVTDIQYFISDRDIKLVFVVKGSVFFSLFQPQSV
jgi:hypothetical protein